MLTFPTQQKILGEILSRPSNSHCSDCNNKSPTWASLDFGVFLCSNCSGAHRSLGPTVTRVKSTKLDLWDRSWVENMKLGNREINLYWQHDNAYALTKPKPGADSDQIHKYVNAKYIKKKFVKPNCKDPLNAYKAGDYETAATEEVVEKQPQVKAVVVKQNKMIPKLNPVGGKTAPTAPKSSPSDNLLDDWHEGNNLTPQNVVNTNPPTQSAPLVEDQQEDEFTEYTSGGEHLGDGQNQNHSMVGSSVPVVKAQQEQFESYEQLMKKHSNSNNNNSDSAQQPHFNNGSQWNNNQMSGMYQQQHSHQNYHQMTYHQNAAQFNNPMMPHGYQQHQNHHQQFYSQPHMMGQNGGFGNNFNGHYQQQQYHHAPHQMNGAMQGQQVPMNWTLN